jgi:hypothetical protein
MSTLRKQRVVKIKKILQPQATQMKKVFRILLPVIKMLKKWKGATAIRTNLPRLQVSALFLWSQKMNKITRSKPLILMKIKMKNSQVLNN